MDLYDTQMKYLYILHPLGRSVGAPRYSLCHWAPLSVGTTKGNWGGFKHKAMDGIGWGWILIQLDGRGVCLPSGLGHGNLHAIRALTEAHKMCWTWCVTYERLRGLDAGVRHCLSVFMAFSDVRAPGRKWLGLSMVYVLAM